MKTYNPNSKNKKSKQIAFAALNVRGDRNLIKIALY